MQIGQICEINMTRRVVVGSIPFETVVAVTLLFEGTEFNCHMLICTCVSVMSQSSSRLSLNDSSSKVVLPLNNESTLRQCCFWGRFTPTPAKYFQSNPWIATQRRKGLSQYCCHCDTNDARDGQFSLELVMARNK